MKIKVDFVAFLGALVFAITAIIVGSSEAFPTAGQDQSSNGDGRIGSRPVRSAERAEKYFENFTESIGGVCESGGKIDWSDRGIDEIANYKATSNVTRSCDPRKLLMCRGGLCKCGLVNAKRKGNNCVGLAGAPCDFLFGRKDNEQFKMHSTAVCDEGLVCNDPIVGAEGMDTVFTYRSCQCKDSRRVPDRDGGCKGWQSGAWATFCHGGCPTTTMIIMTFTLVLPLFFTFL